MEKIMEERTDSRRYDMFTVLFTILTFIVFGKLLIFAIKACQNFSYGFIFTLCPDWACSGRVCISCSPPFGGCRRDFTAQIP